MASYATEPSLTVQVTVPAPLAAVARPFSRRTS
jgi:hypothetical protein